MQTFSSFGNYKWIKTAATNLATMDCEYYSGTTGSVSRICDEFGNWQDLTYSSSCITRSESILITISSVSNHKIDIVILINFSICCGKSHGFLSDNVYPQ